MNYREIDKEFNYQGFTHKQIKRVGDIAIYSKRANEGAIHPCNYNAGFEVVIISRHDGYEIAGNKFEPAEIYPSSTSWGVKGWSYKTISEAEQKFQLLLNENTK